MIFELSRKIVYSSRATASGLLLLPLHILNRYLLLEYIEVSLV
jgi:hypothetical protein